MSIYTISRVASLVTKLFWVVVFLFEYILATSQKVCNGGRHYKKVLVYHTDAAAPQEGAEFV